MPDPICILLVDDEQRNLDALEAILEDPDYRLLRAGDADKALRLLLENDVAAIVLDIKMPGVSGFELAQIIKGTKKFRQIPIVFLTAYHVDDRDIVTGYGAGAVDYLTKPVNPEILRHKVAVFAELFRKTRALAELNEHLEARVQERTAELERSETALRTANVQKDEFLATLAHELRNPLAPLRTGLDVLLRQPGPETAARTLSVMNRQLDHMVRLIDDLLDVSRIGQGTLEMRKETFELSEIIGRAVETVQPSLTRREQAVSVDAPEQVAAFVDGTRIVQIVGNLLSNASKHSALGATVRVQLRCDSDVATIRVVDQGAGIPPGQLARVFDRFAKIERSTPTQNDGLGIGLSLSRQLADLHGGTLTAASSGEGKGATFTLSLPALDRDTVPEPVPKNRVTSNGSPAGLKVVVVEDNEDSAEMLATWLRTLGHDVRVATTGTDGVALVLATRPDVVLCDLGLPGIDGAEVCRQVVLGMSVPPLMVALTGWGMEGDRARTGEAGFDHHLVKPVELDQLSDVLQSLEEP
ncbi:MAG TPA: response regulator [Polyangiaceae bacterium]|jgi:signal transduction histidine kinase